MSLSTHKVQYNLCRPFQIKKQEDQIKLRFFSLFSLYSNHFLRGGHFKFVDL